MLLVLLQLSRCLGSVVRNETLMLILHEFHDGCSSLLLMLVVLQLRGRLSSIDILQVVDSVLQLNHLVLHLVPVG